MRVNKNEYVYKDDYYVLDITSRKGLRQITFIDKEDYERISKYNWCYSKVGYPQTWIHKNKYYVKGSCTIKGLHVLILGNKPTPFSVVDHKNGNRLDNRKHNLRWCTRAENRINTSKTTGVSLYKGKWNAYIQVNGIFIHPGRRILREDALKLRHEATKRYFGDFSPTN